MVKTMDYKLVFRSDLLDEDHYSELYDVKNDPQELHNLYNDIKYSAI